MYCNEAPANIFSTREIFTSCSLYEPYDPDADEQEKILKDMYMDCLYEEDTMNQQDDRYI